MKIQHSMTLVLQDISLSNNQDIYNIEETLITLFLIQKIILNLNIEEL